MTFSPAWLYSSCIDHARLRPSGLGQWTVTAAMYGTVRVQQQGWKKVTSAGMTALVNLLWLLRAHTHIQSQAFRTHALYSIPGVSTTRMTGHPVTMCCLTESSWSLGAHRSPPLVPQHCGPVKAKTRSAYLWAGQKRLNIYSITSFFYSVCLKGKVKDGFHEYLR